MSGGKASLRERQAEELRVDRLGHRPACPRLALVELALELVEDLLDVPAVLVDLPVS